MTLLVVTLPGRKIEILVLAIGSMMLLFIVVVAREFHTHRTLEAEFVVQHVWWIVHHLAIGIVQWRQFSPWPMKWAPKLTAQPRSISSVEMSQEAETEHESEQTAHKQSVVYPRSICMYIFTSYSGGFQFSIKHTQTNFFYCVYYCHWLFWPTVHMAFNQTFTSPNTQKVHITEAKSFSEGGGRY